MSDFTSTGASHDREEMYAITEIPASSAPEAGASCVSLSATAFIVSEVATASYPEAGASCIGAPPTVPALETV